MAAAGARCATAGAVGAECNTIVGAVNAEGDEWPEEHEVLEEL